MPNQQEIGLLETLYGGSSPRLNPLEQMPQTPLSSHLSTPWSIAQPNFPPGSLSPEQIGQLQGWPSTNTPEDVYWPQWATVPPGFSSPGQRDFSQDWGGVKKWWLDLPEYLRPTSPGWWLQSPIQANPMESTPSPIEPIPSPSDPFEGIPLPIVMEIMLRIGEALHGRVVNPDLR